MELFSDIIHQVRDFIESRPQKRCWSEHPALSWPAGGNRGIVMKEDLGLELGSPDVESVSSLLWTVNLSGVSGGRITLIGPDFPEARNPALPFGKVVLVGVDGFTEENTYDRHRDMDFLRYDLDLKGFMIRAVSQYQKEWCRISKEAIQSGFSAQILASALMRLFHARDYVQSVEVIMVTSSPEDVTELRGIVAPAARIIAAMDKMALELNFDCEACDYQDVCDDAEQLKSMRLSLQNKKGETRNA
ncbi:MAG TPA: hypothetical protein ENN34_02950 [Deltaproteobacteria bacterium]|nr:hypothetical protein [Deltaproteobacteria bacterium]